MSTGDSTDFKELVRTRTDLVELIGESIALTPQRGDRDYVGLCPFHDDNRPSMHVYRDRQTWRCWVCDKGGDCFSFVMDYERLEFPDALRLLAERAHLELPQKQRANQQADQARSGLYDVLNWSCQQFHACLLESTAAQPARDYLHGRGINEETIQTFQIGFHPPEWQWLLNRARNRFEDRQLVEAQLAAPRAQGHGLRDHFYDRVLFPIHDPRGRCVAFGGRILPGAAAHDAPKYINSPESQVFPKSKLLYGLSIARNAIRQSGCVVVVEGYTDCCLAHQFGQCNVVATLGTALTDSHVLALKRFARRVVLMYDGDSAGQNAMERSLIKFLAQDVDLRVMSLPGETDPADFLIQHGRQALQQKIEEATEAWDYKFNTCLQTHGTDSIDSRQRVLEDMLAVVAVAPGIQGTMREDVILGKLAQRLGV
ncbi:MAG: DNA primase, partial [Planctomycetaceae bacterium]